MQLKIKILSEGFMMINFYVKVLGFFPTIDLQKIRGCYFCLNEMRTKITKVL